jgi:hypothetical protein
VVIGALVLGPLPAGAAKKAKQQRIEGEIALPAPFIDDSGCFAGLHRRAVILSGGEADSPVNGVIGYSFEVDPATANKPFVLEVSEGQGTVDLDITFYTKFGTPEDVVNDPAGAGAPATVDFATRAPGGEAGKVPPKDYPLAIICMYGGQQGAGALASFVYTAGKGVKLPKG